MHAIANGAMRAIANPSAKQAIGLILNRKRKIETVVTIGYYNVKLYTPCIN